MAALRRTSVDIAGRFGGGVVSAVSPSRSGDATAFVWSEREFPAWPRVGVVDDRGAIVLTRPEVRICGQPSWAASGELAVGGFVGVRRVVFDIGLAMGAVRHLAGGPAASYDLVEYVSAGVAVCRRRWLDGSVDLVRTRNGADELLARERSGLPAWRDARLVSWRSGAFDLEGIFVPAAAADPPWAVMVFLHGGPVASLAAGEAERVGAWADPRFATFIPEFPASGICGEAAMLAAFEAAELPEHDLEVDAVLAGIDSLVESGLVHEQRLFLVGHSYGAYLVNRALTRTGRFRAAVCWEGVADLRLLDKGNLAHQTRWRGGPPDETPERWSAASPIDRAERVCTPTLLYYGADSGLVVQGRHWYEALRAAGVTTSLIVEDGVGHTFATDEGLGRFWELAVRWFREHLT